MYLRQSLVLWSVRVCVVVGLLAAACAPAAPSPTAAPPKPAAEAPKPAAQKPAEKPAQKPEPKAEARPAAKAVDLSNAKTVEEVLAAVKGLSAADREKALLEKATKEGEFLWYTSMQADEATKYIAAFQKKYSGIKANFLRKGGGALFETTMNEARAGKQLWDAQSANAEFVYAYLQQGLITAYDSPTRAELPRAFKAADGTWTAFYLLGVPLSWNTNKVKAADAPKSYQDLLDPKWKGKFSLDTEDFEWFQYINQVMGEKEGMELHKQLKANDPLMIRGRTTQLEQLIAGEFSIGAALHDQAVASAKAKGAPVDLEYSPRPLVKQEAMVIAKQAPHPAAAVLFLDWAFSQEGQQLLPDLFKRTAPHPKVKPAHAEIAKVFEGEYVALDLMEFSKNFEAIQTRFKDIYLK